MSISYLSFIIVVMGIIGFPYGFKIFCKVYVIIKKIQASFIVNITKIKCTLIKCKSIIKLEYIKQYQYIKTKILLNRFYRKEISILNKRGEIETSNKLKKLIKEINKFKRERFMRFAVLLTDELNKELA